MAADSGSLSWWEDQGVRWPSRPGSAPDAAGSGKSGDALDKVAWEVLSGVVAAASTGDANAHAEVFRRWPADVPGEGRRASVYLWFLLRYRVAEVLGRRPAPEDLHELAVRVYPRFARLTRQDEGRLEATFRTVFDSAESPDHLRGSMFLILGTAALGALLDDAEPELAVMRPHLAEWWQRNADEFRDRGVR
jgi:hypothetical protein